MTAPESPYESGASIATPRVASMAVIAQQVAKEIMGREWDAEELKRLLHESARLPEWGIADEEAHGYDPRYGFGLVRLDRVIQNARLAASMRKRADQGNGLNGEPKWYSSFEKEVRRGRERTVRHVFHEAIWNAARDRALLDKSAKNMLKDRLDPQTTQVFHVDPGAPVKLRVPFDDMLPVNGKGAVIDTVNFELLLSGYVVFNGMESLLAQTPRMINPKRLNSEDQKAALAGLQALLVSRMTAKLKTNDEREVSVFADASMVEENDWPEVPFEDADGKPASYGSFLSTRETSYSLQDFGARRQDGHLKPYKNPDTGLKRVTTVEGLYLARLDSLWMQIGIDDSKRRGRNLVEDVHSYIRKNLPELMLEAVRPQDLRIELYVDVPRVTVEAWDPVPQ